MSEQRCTHADAAPRRPYVSPRLVELGDLRSLTLGGSPGFGDSGIGSPRRPLVIGEAPIPPFDRAA
ncbi:MAG TPA: lasso RiPP family leader peptide-containing protein [Thermoanaerobaculia bacterium]|nr:lasso RiPP family leader peptide-containing protein [Thermoanaerobaculia bacterium]